MGGKNQLQRHYCQGRPLRRDVRAQGHRLRIRVLDFAPVQTLPDQGIPALKDEELRQLGWDIRRNLTKINYRIHTDAIKERLVPPELTARQVNLVYASEADVLNMALFGMTAKQWREANPGKKGNIRDYAGVSQLVCLSNLENLNALFIRENAPQAERLRKLNRIAIQQMKLLTDDSRVKRLEAKHK